MTTDGLHIDEASLRNLNVNIKTFQSYVLQSALTGLKRYAMFIVAKAQRNIENNGSDTFTVLKKSGRPIPRQDNTVDAGFWCAYAEFVEYGRKSGKMPPIDMIYAWLEKKQIEPKPYTKEVSTEKKVHVEHHIVKRKREKKDMTPLQRARWSMAYLIARSIGEHGSKPHPFLKPAYDEYRTEIGQFMQQTIDQAVEQFKPKK